jgi:predicted DNA binding CopG/RHH family protein
MAPKASQQALLHSGKRQGLIAEMSKAKRRTTESITLRVESSVLNRIRYESEQKLVSVNTLMNQILKQYVKWHSHTPNAGMFYISRNLMSSLLRKFSDEEIIKLSEQEIRDSFKKSFFVFYEEYNLENVLELLDYYARASGLNYTHRIENNNHTIIIHPDMGEKASLLLSSLIRNVVKTLPIPPSAYDIQQSNGTLIIKIKT